VHQALDESTTARGLLSMSRDEFEQECARLRACVDTLKEEKAKIMTDHEADLAAEQKKF
jgi:hypothetical protein